MPVFYFDLRDGEAFVKDKEGLDLPDIEAAQIEASEFLADAITDICMRPARSTGYSMSIEVRNSKKGLFALSFQFETD